MQTKFAELTDSQWQYIEKILEKERGKRRRWHDLRRVMNAILWITRTGVQWRNLDSKYPCWSIVYYYFNKWQKRGILKKLLSGFVKAERIRNGREAEASRVAIDSQSVKKVSFIHLDTGIDGGKKVNGRKRHLAVDSLGLPIGISVYAKLKVMLNNIFYMVYFSTLALHFSISLYIILFVVYKFFAIS
jgi:putative transposase